MKAKLTRHTVFLIVPLLLLVLLSGLFQGSWAQNNAESPALVVLTASWCAKCREVDPMVKRVIQEFSARPLKLVVLDVDSNSAPQEAELYKINLSGTSVPEVYLFSKGKTMLIFEGSSYQFGQSRQAKARILNALERNF